MRDPCRTRHDPDHEIAHLRLDHAARLRFHNLICCIGRVGIFAKPMSGLFVLPGWLSAENRTGQNPNKNRLQVFPLFLTSQERTNRRWRTLSRKKLALAKFERRW